MNNENQLQLVIIYLLKMGVDFDYKVYKDNHNFFTIDGEEVYVNIDDNSEITYKHLDIIHNKHHVICLFRYSIEKIYRDKGIRIYVYFEERMNNKVALVVKTESSTIRSKYYFNHCFAYIDILMRLNNVYIDLEQYDIQKIKNLFL